MKNVSRVIRCCFWRMISSGCLILGAASCQSAQEIPLQAVVTPSTEILKNGEPVKFAIHGFVEFKSLAEVFPYIDAQAVRWNGKITEEERKTGTCASATPRGD